MNRFSEIPPVGFTAGAKVAPRNSELISVDGTKIIWDKVTPFVIQTEAWLDSEFGWILNISELKSAYKVNDLELV